MKRLVVLLTVALVLVFSVSALAGTSPTIGAKTVVTFGSRNADSRSTTTTTTNAADQDSLNDDVSKYTNDPAKIKEDYDGIDTFNKPVIFESVPTVGINSDSLTISQVSRTENDKVAVFIVYRLDGKLVRVRLEKFHWENGKIVCEIPEKIAREIDGKQIRVDLIGEAK